MGRVWTPAESLAYTRWLATSHYENFHVVSFLLPKRLHQDFYNVYAFCRWADDLGDEMGDTAESLRLLGWWRGELDRMYGGAASHPVFVALGPTVRQYGLERQTFADLIHAFEQDQEKNALRGLGRGFRILCVLGQPGGAVGFGVMRIPGRRAVCPER
jgi:phytoene/squalene synthetase